MLLTTIAKSNRLRCLALAAVSAALLNVVPVPTANADEMDKKTIVTTNAPTEVPGRVLPPGTYVFKLLDSSSNRNIVQIFDKDEKRLYATVLAVPDYRLQPSDKPLIQFEERAANAPEAIKAWFYPGDQYGQQFVYPHKRAAELAKQHNGKVLSMSDDMAKHMKTQSTSASDDSIQSLKKTEVAGVDPSGAPVELEVVILSKPPQ
jgi:hypothetical protein